ncbi:hypothetical protein ACKF11_13145 [Methylobacillus sp. Pita2]|uniref:hypothetical protein n=1 Tax=Methylobacillus sp. Pita2 TaxID=3383245 RepID=UPI0038B49F7A
MNLLDPDIKAKLEIIAAGDGPGNDGEGSYAHTVWDGMEDVEGDIFCESCAIGKCEDLNKTSTGSLPKYSYVFEGVEQSDTERSCGQCGCDISFTPSLYYAKEFFSYPEQAEGDLDPRKAYIILSAVGKLEDEISKPEELAELIPGFIEFMEIIKSKLDLPAQAIQHALTRIPTRPRL